MKHCIIFILILAPETILAQKDFYTPKSLLMPFHDQKNQLHISIGRGGGYDLNLSYAFSDKFVLFNTTTIDNGTKRRTSLFGDRYNVKRNDYVLKGGLGYFHKTDKSWFSIIETYVGAGISKVDNYWHFTDNYDGEFTQARYWSAFGQFNAGKKIRRSEVAFGIRFAYSQYLDFSFYSDHPNLSYIKRRFENLRGFTAEPVMSYSYILKGFKLNAQAGLAMPLASPSVWRIDTHTTNDTTNDQTTIIRSRDKAELLAALGRLSIQYNLNFSKQR